MVILFICTFLFLLFFYPVSWRLKRDYLHPSIDISFILCSILSKRGRNIRLSYTTFVLTIQLPKIVSEICDGDELWQWSQLDIRQNVFGRSSIPQKRFIIIIIQKRSRFALGPPQSTICSYAPELRTFWGWEIQEQKTEMTMIYVLFKNLLTKLINLNTIKIIFCGVITCSIGLNNFNLEFYFHRKKEQNKNILRLETF